MLCGGFPVTILAVSLDDVAGDLGGTTSTLTWTITGAMLGFVVMMPLAGKVGDLRGHRRVFLGGLALLVVASVASSLAWSAGSLIGCRVLGGLVVSTVFTLILVPTLFSLMLEFRRGVERVPTETAPQTTAQPSDERKPKPVAKEAALTAGRTEA